MVISAPLLDGDNIPNMATTDPQRVGEGEGEGEGHGHTHTLMLDHENVLSRLTTTPTFQQDGCERTYR